jgi:hypothetical protein
VQALSQLEAFVHRGVKGYRLNTLGDRQGGTNSRRPFHSWGTSKILDERITISPARKTRRLLGTTRASEAEDGSRIIYRN